MTTASDHIEVVSGQTWNAFRQREIFREMDLVLVNGNHHQATAQIVIIDPAKADSLQRRLDQMTRVELVLFQEGQDRVFDFLLEKMPELSEVPTFQLNDIQAIVGFLESRLAERAPLLNGLVLAGGQSLRMGRDKGTLDWHGQPQRDYLAQLIRPFCSETYLSCREDQASMMPENVPLLFDSFTGLGPFGAILSAFRERPDHAWLVVACDLPLLDAATLQYLTDHRTPGRLATAFRDADEGLPEPLIAIWEPAAYPVLLSFLAQGYSCPRKVLIQSNTLLLDAPDPKTLTNVNTPEDADKVRETLQRQ